MVCKPLLLGELVLQQPHRVGERRDIKRPVSVERVECRGRHVFNLESHDVGVLDEPGDCRGVVRVSDQHVVCIDAGHGCLAETHGIALEIQTLRRLAEVRAELAATKDADALVHGIVSVVTGKKRTL